MESYFFIAVSNKENIELCKKYAYAGFPNTLNGLWAYVDINEGDFVTFLYGARAHNLYRVKEKEAILDAESLPPWKSIHFRKYNKIYYFPYRIHLEPIREFEEPLARPEFIYIADNLLRRGGYEKTHFQADRTTLQNVSSMGSTAKSKLETLAMPTYRTFIPLFARGKDALKLPKVSQFKEMILQSLVRQYLSKPSTLTSFFNQIGFKNIDGEQFELLGERALEEGHVDILMKESQPKGTVKQIVAEVKLGTASIDHATQLEQYIKSIGDECEGGILIAERILPKVLSASNNIRFVAYSFGDINLRKPHTFEELLSSIRLLSQGKI